MATAIDLGIVERIIAEVAAAEAMPRFRKLKDGDIEMKGVNDPVTIADKETERHLTARLTDYLPGSVVVGEESFALDKGIMARLQEDAPVWIIDPIDGTRNFVAGKPEFAVMVALVKNLQPVASWIHDPNSGDTIMAEKGAGVWLRGQKLKLAATVPNLPTVCLVGTRVMQLITDPNVIPTGTSLPPVEIGSCAGFDYPRLFAGEVTFANASTSRVNALLYRHTNAWDHIPGLCLHQEAGGYHADWSGKPYNMTDPRAGLLYAPTKTAWDELYKAFEPLRTHALKKAS